MDVTCRYNWGLDLSDRVITCNKSFGSYLNGCGNLSIIVQALIMVVTCHSTTLILISYLKDVVFILITLMVTCQNSSPHDLDSSWGSYFYDHGHDVYLLQQLKLWSRWSWTWRLPVIVVKALISMVMDMVMMVVHILETFFFSIFSPLLKKC